MITKLLIANRGEIACRVARSAHRLGIRTVAVFSDADEDAPHVSAATEAVRIGPAEAALSYLDPERLIKAARKTGADAVHPGYGFLSENASFARRVEEAGLVWVGPPAGAIESMGDKAAAKAEMSAAGVPMAPGFSGAASPERLLEEAERIGFPLMIKAVAGGGGRGIRIVRDAAAFPEALRGARSEATNAFGSGEVMLEKFMEGARHIEIQVMADTHGNVVHLFERDCSAQRRRQKIVEESPSPSVDEGLRARMGDAAVQAARRIGYVGAGTVEFLVDGDGFYFLEMNTRLQVEHPVTELVTGTDLVEAQLRVAMGEALPWSQQDLSISGHAIEARLYAEDPSRGFLPCTGRILSWLPSPSVRVDGGIREGQEIGIHYDPMLAKLVSWGPDRGTALRLLLAAVEESRLAGVQTNRHFLAWLLRQPGFQNGEVDTGWVERQEWPSPAPSDQHWAVAAAVLATSDGYSWGTRGPQTRWLPLAFGEELRTLAVLQTGPASCEVDGTSVSILRQGEGLLRCEVDGRRWTLGCVRSGGAVLLDDEAASFRFSPPDPFASEDDGEESLLLRAPMAGRVVSVQAAAGDSVNAGQTVVVIEAMKMEHPVKAATDGVLEELFAEQGQQVSSEQLLGRIGEAEQNEETE